jgi:hypothetical protein
MHLSPSSSSKKTTTNLGVVLLLQVPRTNEKKELAAEQMLASLHGLLMMPVSNGFLQPSIKRECLSLEIAVLKKRIGFYIWVPDYMKSFVEEQIYAQYPNVQISEVLDYSSADNSASTTFVGTELKFTANDVLPIKTFQSFEVDPLAAITGALAKFSEEEEAWIQLVIRPAASNWHRRSERYISNTKGRSSTLPGSIVSALWTAPTPSTASKGLTEYEQTRASAAEEKSQKLAYEACIRIIYHSGLSMQQARLRLQSITASYRQFNTTYLNGFTDTRIDNSTALLQRYQKRFLGKSSILVNIEEVATLYHLPHTNVETPYILWAISKTAEPPANLPLVAETDSALISPIAITNFRGHNTVFGMPRYDRGRHLYIIGQTGVGKSALLELLTIADVYSPYGLAVIDPHGDYALSILRRVPEQRINDVIYFNPADVDFPMSFNPMEVTDPKLKSHIASEIIGVLKRMFESWGPRLEYILRYSLLALLDYPEATMLDITRLLTDAKFRDEVMKHVTDAVVLNFWQVEFKSWNDRFAAEAVAPILNKVGAFTANPLVRNIIGQPKSSFNIRQIMDEHKILIVNLSRGLIGEDNAAILGALLVTKIQLAAMSRADMPVEERTPFYLYVDEFQNFATDSFSTILSEARKYGLNLTVANQYIAQVPLEVRDAIFGNVGSIIGFRMSADDGNRMQRYFEPSFEEQDLIHMHNRHFVISMTIQGEKAQAFSAITIELPPQERDNSETIIESSRRQYAFNKSSVEGYIHDRYTARSEKKPVRQAPQPKPATGSPTTAATVSNAATTVIDRVRAAALATRALHSDHGFSSLNQEDQTEQIEPAIRPLQPTISEQPLSGTSSGDEVPQAPKRKRTRRRKRSNKSAAEAAELISQQQTVPERPQQQRQHPPRPQSIQDEVGKEHVIRLR